MPSSTRTRSCLIGIIVGSFALLSVTAEAQNSPVQLRGRVEKCDHIEARRVQLEVHACLLKANDAKRSVIEAAEQQRRNADLSCKGDSLCRGRNRLARDTAARDAQQAHRQTSTDCRNQMAEYQNQCRAQKSASRRDRHNAESSEHAAPRKAIAPLRGSEEHRLATPLGNQTASPSSDSLGSVTVAPSGAGSLELAPANKPNPAPPPVGKSPETSRR